MDNLAMDMIRCRKDGFGAHYGHWKVLHPHTEEENIQLIEDYEAAEYAKKHKPMRDPIPCPICGKIWQPRPGCAKFCSKECRKKAMDIREKERKRRSIIANTIFTVECQWCGKKFVKKGGSTRKYCCEKCSKAAANFRAAERHRNAKKEAAQND